MSVQIFVEQKLTFDPNFGLEFKLRVSKYPGVQVNIRMDRHREIYSPPQSGGGIKTDSKFTLTKKIIYINFLLIILM